MACESGVEGKMRVKNDTTNTNASLKVFNWTLESDPNLQECTNATTGGIQTMSPVKKGYKVTFDCYVDSGSQPEEVGVVEGATVDVWLRVGTLKGYNAWEMVLGPVSLKGCDANGLVTYNGQAHANEAKPALANYAG